MNTSVVFISGGATGIGRVIAQRFLRDGARVHVADVDPAAVSKFISEHPGATGSACDVGDPAQVDRAFEELRAKHGRLDVLINNAGIAGPTGRVEDIDPDAWQRTIAVDLNGQFYCARQAVPLLRAAGGGSIICIASTAALFGFPLRSPYAACKWAIIGFMKTLAMELGPEKIRVNAICPGSVSGPRIDGVIERDAASRGMEPQAIRDIYLRQTSMRTFVDAEDVAEMAHFLASKAGAKISGQAIAIDGHTEGLSNWLD
ncbi:MAG: SDR family oxidoreductase [Gammaproteobacteria bacterium]|nr:SDR family oxidoreductase [Gammaproteobacteria bacterium]